MAKTAIITGSSSGIGRESAVALSKAGWNVVLTARRADALQETALLYVTDEEFVKKLFSETVTRFGRLDLLFNNAGVTKTFQNVISVNLVGPFLCAREAVKVFKNQTPIGGDERPHHQQRSLSAHTPRPMTIPYTVSKHGITGLSKCIALDGRAFDITWNATTALTAVMGQGMLQGDGRFVPEATFDVAHVAAAVVHIASLPPDVAVPHFTIMASKAPFAGRG
ncbi:hypothetical protein B0H13DRAFT_2248124 [Mycena leptocephala]|nr:hypothetical protein B0H13DRAFT_2248124 [Mycena leptocephala]